MNKNNNLQCGIDSLELTFNSEQNIIKKTIKFTRKEHNKTIDYAVLNRKADGEYKMSICLPKLLTENNLIPFGINNETILKKVTKILYENLSKIFGEDRIPYLKVTRIELSLSFELSKRELINPIMNFLAKAFLSSEKCTHLYVKGRQSKRCVKCEVLNDIVDILSFHTKRNSDGLGSYKCYDKTSELLEKGILLEEDITSSVLRLEWILIDRGITKFLGDKRSLSDLLTVESLRKLIQGYYNYLFVKDGLFDRCTRLGRDFRKVMRKDIKELSPREFILLNKEVCEIDYFFVKEIMSEHYINIRTAQKIACRMKSKLKNQINFTEGCINELRTLKKLVLHNMLTKL